MNSLLKDLAKAKALFQQKTLEAIVTQKPPVASKPLTSEPKGLGKE